MKIFKYYRKISRFYWNYRNRKNLKNKDFTIISSNCIGGVISHELGLKFKSPTINLFFYPEDYIKFISNLKYYILECELIEEQYQDSIYPIGRLDDVIIHFVHYSNFINAKKKWEERCKRINWDNLFFIMVERDGCKKEYIEKFDELEYENKIIFTTFKYRNIKSSYYIIGTNNNSEVIDLCSYKNFWGKRWIDDFDYVNFLNSKS